MICTIIIHRIVCFPIDFDVWIIHTFCLIHTRFLRIFVRIIRAHCAACAYIKRLVLFTTGRTGKFFRDGVEDRSSVESYDKDLQKDIWKKSCRLTNMKSFAETVTMILAFHNQSDSEK